MTAIDREPATPAFLPDAIEALVALDRLEEARPLVAWLEERVQSLGRDQVSAWAARCRGLLLASGDEVEAAGTALVHGARSSRTTADPLRLCPQSPRRGPDSATPPPAASGA